MPISQRLVEDDSVKHLFLLAINHCHLLDRTETSGPSCRLLVKKGLCNPLGFLVHFSICSPTLALMGVINFGDQHLEPSSLFEVAQALSC